MNKSPAMARWAVMAVFLLHGLLLGAWAPHIALAKERLGAGSGLFGALLLSLPIGAVVAMPIAGALINKYGSARMTLMTGLMFCAAMILPAHAPSILTFIFSGMLLGIAMGSMDVSMNAHGLAIEKDLKRPIMSGLHGGFSLGAAFGAFGGGGLMKIIGASNQIVFVALFCAAGIFFVSRYFLSSDVDKGLSGSHFAWPTWATIGLGSLCFLALMIEGSILDWGAILMRERFLVDASFAAFAFGAYQAGMAASRFAGDWLRQRFGAVPMVVWSALLCAAATAMALTVNNPMLSSIGFVFAGIGIGNLAPVLFAGGGRLEPDAPGRGIAAVTTLGYTGFLVGPPMIGFVAEFSNLSAALGLTVVAALIIAMFARAVAPADSY